MLALPKHLGKPQGHCENVRVETKINSGLYLQSKNIERDSRLPAYHWNELDVGSVNGTRSNDT